MTKYGPDREMIPIEKFGNPRDPLYVRTIVHYTSITTLFKIIRTKTIRLNRIDNVNDLEEKDHLLVNDNYRRVFISCFSYSIKESIPMWQIYTNKETGVMLKIKFKTSIAVDELLYRKAMRSNNGTEIPIMFGYDEQWRRNPWQIKYDAVKINYQDDPSLSSYMHVTGEDIDYDIPDNFALCKSKAWEYEKELRFRAIIKSNVVGNTAELEEMSSLFSPLNFDAIEKITIIFNPWMDKDDWADTIRYLFVKQKINVPIEIRNSSLYKKIR